MAKKRAKTARRKGAATKTVKLKLTPQQQKILSNATKGEFTVATFAFPKGKQFAPPRARVACSLTRVAPNVKRGR